MTLLDSLEVLDTEFNCEGGIEKRKISDIQQEVNRVLDVKAEELDKQLDDLNEAILQKEIERTEIINELARKPFSRCGALAN